MQNDTKIKGNMEYLQSNKNRQKLLWKYFLAELTLELKHGTQQICTNQQNNPFVTNSES